MKDIVEAFFRSRNIINHQLASFNDFLPTHDNPKSRMQRIIDSIRIGEVDNERGLIRLDVDKLDEESIDVKLGRITVGNPIVKEANGATHEHTPLEARLRDLTYSAPISLEFTIIENGMDREPEKVKIAKSRWLLHFSICLMISSSGASSGAKSIRTGTPSMSKVFGLSR